MLESKSNFRCISVVRPVYFRYTSGVLPAHFRFPNFNDLFKESNDSPAGLAYNIRKKAQIQKPSAHVFKDRPFPTDFSLLTTLKVKKRHGGNNRMYLLSLFNHNGMKQIGVEVDSNPSFLYVDDRSTARDSDHPSWNVNFADGCWHRVAWSVKTESNGDSTIELYVD